MWWLTSLLWTTCLGTFSGGYPDCVPQFGRVTCSARSKQYASQISVACVGDSITSGSHSSGPSMTYPAQLQQLLGSNFVVTNLGASGATLQKHGDSPYWTRPQYQTLIQNKWDVVIIMLGTNDAKDNGSGGPSNWLHDCTGANPLSNCSFGTDYAALISEVRTLGNPKIYIMVPPPLMEARAIGANQTVINTVFPTLIPLINTANNLSNPPIDIFTAMGGVPNWQTSFPKSCALESPWRYCRYWCDNQSCDQCHPNDDGYALLAVTVQKALVP